MANLFNFTLLSLDGKKYTDEVEALYFECPEKGLTGILANHLDYKTLLFVSVIYTIKDGVKKYFAISGGSLSFIKNKATIIADTFETADEIDEEKVRKAKEEAEAILNSEIDKKSADYANAKFNLQKASNRMRLLK